MNTSRLAYAARFLGDIDMQGYVAMQQQRRVCCATNPR